MLINSTYHLTYCSNIHPGEDWGSIFQNLQTYIPPLKQKLSPEHPFGIGLRIANIASEELLANNALEELKAWLAGNNCYVFTLNGFPYGGFHRQVVKDQVYAPDWTKRDRVSYTQRLIKILAALLPEGIEGGISTVPLSYKPWWKEKGTDDLFEKSTVHLVHLAMEMAAIREKTGQVLHLDLEPEPDATLENTQDVIEYFQHWLWPKGQALLQKHYGKSKQDAQEILQTHLQLCYDTCHFAVEYESPALALEAFHQAGIQIGKVQLSSALKVPIPNDATQRKDILKQLRAFAESTYLHQVIEKNASMPDLVHYEDLTAALPKFLNTSAQEWRTHFHIPIFLDQYPPFNSTQNHIAETLRSLAQWSNCQHLEIETYTWEVLPTDLKLDIQQSIQREYEWVLAELNPSKIAESNTP